MNNNYAKVKKIYILIKEKPYLLEFMKITIIWTNEQIKKITEEFEKSVSIENSI